MRKILTAILFCGVCQLGFANEGGESKLSPDIYRFDPDLITNLVGNSGPQFVKIRIDIKLDKEDSQKVMQYHQALLRDRLLQLLNETDGKNFKEIDKVKELRENAKKALNELLAKETGDSNTVQDVFFTNVITE